MSRRAQTMFNAAVLSGLSLSGTAWAADSVSGNVENSPLTLAVVASPTATPGGTARAPLMDLLDNTPVGSALEAARINVYGHVEGSYTYNFSPPPRNLNLGRVFDIKHNDPEVNQLDLNIERTVDLSSHQFDLGGRVELLYGTDSRFLHSSGFLDHDNFFKGPEYQFDIPQLYVDFGVPVGNGLRIRAGKFLFFKQIDPNASVFYSHSFTFGAALPFTLTGVSGLYNFSDQLSVEAGISRGWGQTFKDNNSSIDGFGRVRFAPSDRTDISVALISGPENDNDDSHYRTAVDATLSQRVSDNLTFLLDGVYGVDAAGSHGSSASWYGVSGYGVLKLDEHFSVGLRLEWYRDEEGFTTALAQNLYEGTAGVTITPFPEDPIGANFKVRPEIRYDYSSRSFFNGLTKHDQTTAAIDAIFNF